jgi:transposase
VWKLLASKKITVLEHPPYSPDLAPSGSSLFLKIKKILEGSNFDDIDDIRNNTTEL